MKYKEFFVQISLQRIHCVCISIKEHLLESSVLPAQIHCVFTLEWTRGEKKLKNIELKRIKLNFKFNKKQEAVHT